MTQFMASLMGGHLVHSFGILPALRQSRTRFRTRHPISLPAGSLADLESLVTTATGEARPLFGLASGKPGHAGMVTVQAMRPGGAILGYIKLPLTEGAGQRIRHEAATLEQLRRSHLLRQHVPEVLFAGEWHDRYTLFQSAGEGTPGPARFHGVHTRFLHHLRRSSAVRRSGGSLVEEAAARWAAAGEKLNAGLRDLGRDALRLAGRQLRGTEIACGIWHGDFAPWNTRVCDGRLFVFNWECAEWDMPIWWDLFHFDLQVECLLRRNSGIDLERVDAPSWNGLYILYLLRSVCRCAEDESGADAIEFRRKKLTRLVAAQPGLRALDPIHVGGGY